LILSDVLVAIKLIIPQSIILYQDYCLGITELLLPDDKEWGLCCISMQTGCVNLW